MRRRVIAVLLGALAIGGCGGGDTDSASSSNDDAASEVTTTTEQESTTTTTTAARSDIKPCELLTTSELEAQASVAGVQKFEPDRTEQAAANLVAAGAFRCTHYFNVIDEGSKITATLMLEVRTKDAAGEYKKLREFGSRERLDVTGVGDKAFYDVENGSISILAKGVVLIVDPGMPGVIKETNRPVAEAVAPLALARL